MIRRKVEDLLRQVEQRPVAKEREEVPALLEPREFKKAPDFRAVLETVGKKGIPTKIVIVSQVAPKDYSSQANGVILTTKQVIRLLGVTHMTIYHWVKKLGLPKHQLKGGKNPPVRFDEGEVLAWMQDVQKKPVALDYLEWK